MRSGRAGRAAGVLPGRAPRRPRAARPAPPAVAESTAWTRGRRPQAPAAVQGRAEVVPRPPQVGLAGVQGQPYLAGWARTCQGSLAQRPRMAGVATPPHRSRAGTRRMRSCPPLALRALPPSPRASARSGTPGSGRRALLRALPHRGGAPSSTGRVLPSTSVNRKVTVPAGRSTRSVMRVPAAQRRRAPGGRQSGRGAQAGAPRRKRPERAVLFISIGETARPDGLARPVRSRGPGRVTRPSASTGRLGRPVGRLGSKGTPLVSSSSRITYRLGAAPGHGQAHGAPLPYCWSGAVPGRPGRAPRPGRRRRPAAGRRRGAARGRGPPGGGAARGGSCRHRQHGDRHVGPPSSRGAGPRGDAPTVAPPPGPGASCGRCTSAGAPPMHRSV